MRRDASRDGHARKPSPPTDGVAEPDRCSRASGSSGCSSPTSATTRSLTLSVGPEPRRAHRRQRLGQDQPARGRLAADARARGCAARPIPSWRAVGSGGLGGRRAPAHAARRRSISAPGSAGDAEASATAPAASCASTAKTSPGSGALADSCRDGLAHAGHGRPVHRARLRAPALSRSPDRRASIPATAPRSGNSSAPCSSATACWPRTCATAHASRASSMIMAETGVAIAAARAAAVAELRPPSRARRDAASAQRLSRGPSSRSSARSKRPSRRSPPSRSRTPTSQRCATSASATARPGRTLDGPHRSDLIVGHGPKEMPAKVCSTGEQKALLIGLVLAHAELVAAAPRRRRADPAAGRDRRPSRPSAARPRCSRKSCAGQPGLDDGHRSEAFSALGKRAQFHRVEEGRIARCSLSRLHARRASA